jgi:hypothetical protein
MSDRDRLAELWQRAHAAAAAAIEAAVRNGVDSSACTAARERLTLERTQVDALLRT